MGEAIYKQLQNFLDAQQSQPVDRRAKIEELVSVAMTVYTFMDYMSEEIERAGYTPLEFLEKFELFLKSVTPTYALSAFEDILVTFKKIDPEFQDTKFYIGLQGLRALCSGDYNAVVELLQEDGRYKIIPKNLINKNLVFFGTFLIEKIIRFIQEMRKSKAQSELTIKQIKDKLEEHFDGCVVQTVSYL